MRHDRFQLLFSLSKVDNSGDFSVPYLHSRAQGSGTRIQAIHVNMPDMLERHPGRMFRFPLSQDIKPVLAKLTQDNLFRRIWMHPFE